MTAAARDGRVGGGRDGKASRLPAQYYRRNRIVRRFAPDEDELIERLRADGGSLMEICRATGRRHNSIVGRLSALARRRERETQDLLISNQVSKSFEQLAGEKMEMRLGGIYALEGVMNTPNSQYRVPVLEASERSSVTIPRPLVPRPRGR